MTSGEDKNKAAPLDPAMEELIRAAEAAVESAEPAAEKDGPDAGAAQAAASEALKAELEETKDRLLRLAAEFENYKKRMARDLERERNQRVESLIRKLVSVLENLDRALALKASDSAGLRSGVELTLQSFRGILEAEGLEKIKTDGVAFDPNLHEALAVVPQEGAEPGSILEVYESGYSLKGMVLKPSRVRVAGKSESPKSPPVSGGEAKPA